MWKVVLNKNVSFILESVTTYIEEVALIKRPDCVNRSLNLFNHLTRIESYRAIC